MKYEYKEMLNILVLKLGEIGFCLCDDQDFLAILQNESSWKIVFGGEPYDRPDYSLSIEDTSCKDSYKKCSYSVYILMDIFLENNITRRSIDTFVSQVDFLVKFKDDIFISPQPYKSIYDSHELNKIVLDM
jgi:hypothetical protein